VEGFAAVNAGIFTVFLMTSRHAYGTPTHQYPGASDAVKHTAFA
jgi:hypothetical protein